MFYRIVLFTITLVNMYLIHSYFMRFRLFYNLGAICSNDYLNTNRTMNYASFNICVD